MKAGREVSDAVTAEQVNVLFRQMPIALGVNVVNAGLSTIALVWMAAGYQSVFWFGVVALVTTGRWLLWRLHRRDPELYAGRWSALATCGSLIAGLSWGIGGALMVPLISPPGQLLLTIVIGGMCAGAVVLSISHLPTLVAFLLAASLPMAGRFFAKGTAADCVLGAEIVVFAGALVLAGNYLNRIFAETMRLRFELNGLNVRLQAEIDDHRETAAS